MTQKKARLIMAALVLVIIAAGAITAYAVVRIVVNNQAQNTTGTDEVPANTSDNNDGNALLSFDKDRYPLDKPDSLWVVVNKRRPLPADFVPPQLTSVGGTELQVEAAKALEGLLKASAQAQVPLRVISGYRSYDTQQSLYNSYTQTDSPAEVDTYSARPGYSEHQTGLAADLGNGSGRCDLEICFASTPGGAWLAANAHTYGFTIRYPEGKTEITGYQYEPWHLRYVGVDLANELRASSKTMEEFFGLPAAPSY